MHEIYIVAQYHDIILHQASKEENGGNLLVTREEKRQAKLAAVEIFGTCDHHLINNCKLK